MRCHLSSEPGGQRSRVRASKADPGVPVAQVEALADVLVEYSQVGKSGQKTHTFNHLEQGLETCLCHVTDTCTDKCKRREIESYMAYKNTVACLRH